MYARSLQYSRRRRGKSARSLWLAVFGLAIVGGLVLASQHWPSEHISHLQPSLSLLSTTAPTPTPSPAFVPLDIQARWQAIAQQFPNVTVSAELREVSSGLTATMAADADFRAASTTKMIAACYFLHLVEQGKHTLDEPMGGYTAKFQLQQMINRSNNDAWVAFLKLVGRTNEEAYAHSQGWTSFNVTDNRIAPNDLADVLQKLWQGKLLNREHTDYLLSLMQQTIDEQWIPPAIPQGSTIYHKYGALEDDVHDAALITYKGRTYALVIMTNGHGSYAYTQRAELFHKLVEAAFGAPG